MSLTRPLLPAASQITLVSPDATGAPSSSGAHHHANGARKQGLVNAFGGSPRLEEGEEVMPSSYVGTSAALNVSTASSSAAASVISNASTKRRARFRMLGLFRSRKASDDSTSSLNSLPGHGIITTSSSSLPPTILEEDGESSETSETKRRRAEQEEERERARIEAVAAEREEKRKRRVSEALVGARRRLDDTTDEIQEDMEEAVERAKWNRAETIIVALVMTYTFFFFPISWWWWSSHPSSPPVSADSMTMATMTNATVALPQDLLQKALDRAMTYAASQLVLITLMITYSFLVSKKRAKDAKQASDDVASRLQDLDEGIRRCELALVHDLQADQEWEREMENERSEWEQKQREWNARRADRPPRNPAARASSRRKRIVDQMRRGAGGLPHMPNPLNLHVPQMPHIQIPKPPFIKQRSNSRGVGDNDSEDGSGGGAAGNSGLSSLLGAAGGGSGELGGSEEAAAGGGGKAWLKYVAHELPIERNPDFTPEEEAFAERVREALGPSRAGMWDSLPRDLRLMILRGYADKKDRLMLSVEGTIGITNWRAKYRCDETLKLTNVDPDVELFNRCWSLGYAGEDAFGHLIVYERIEDLNIHELANRFDDDETIRRLRTMQMEVVRELKRRGEARRGHRVSKHIYIVDLKGLSLTKHFSAWVRAKLPMVFAIGGDQYPDSLWTLWLINTPLTFRAVKTVIFPMIDPVVRAKIHVVGGKDKYLPEMERHGMPRSALPETLGGTYRPSRTLLHELHDIAAANRAVVREEPVVVEEQQ